MLKTFLRGFGKKIITLLVFKMSKYFLFCKKKKELPSNSENNRSFC